jgi:hypothetical protein
MVDRRLRTSNPGEVAGECGPRRSGRGNLLCSHGGGSLGVPGVEKTGPRVGPDDSSVSGRRGQPADPLTCDLGTISPFRAASHTRRRPCLRPLVARFSDPQRLLMGMGEAICAVVPIGAALQPAHTQLLPHEPSKPSRLWLCRGLNCGLTPVHRTCRGRCRWCISIRFDRASDARSNAVAPHRRARRHGLSPPCPGGSSPSTSGQLSSYRWPPRHSFPRPLGPPRSHHFSTLGASPGVTASVERGGRKATLLSRGEPKTYAEIFLTR